MLLPKFFRKKTAAKKIAVLMYHRIGLTKFDPWDLSVSPPNFDQQLSLLKKKYTILPIHELLTFLAGDDLPGQAVCLSFDDAYTDNFSIALPILEKHQAPATFFVPDYFIEHKQAFWWDELAEIISKGKGMDITNFPERATWRWPQVPPDEICEEFISSWETLRQLPYSLIRQKLDLLREVKNYPDPVDTALLPMTKEQLRQAAESRLVSIALHTSTHPFLTALTPAEQRQELSTNINWIKQFRGAIPTVLAYPFGNYTQETIRLLQELGIALAFTTRAETVQKGSAVAELGRFQVKDWSATIFDKQLEQWFSN